MRVSDPRLAAPLQATEAVLGDGPVEAPGANPGPSQQQELGEASNDEGSAELIAEFVSLGHDVFHKNSVYCCRKCAGTTTLATSRNVRKLRRVCAGL